MARRLRSAGVGHVRGFALNVSNFMSNRSSKRYGRALARALGGSHFVIDTSRNGRGPRWANGAPQLCNPPGRGLGRYPTAHTGSRSVDAYLWVKTPGESDGRCHGDPSAGSWWPRYALGLAARAAG